MSRASTGKASVGEKRKSVDEPARNSQMEGICPWAIVKGPIAATYLQYHDTEWGRPVRDDPTLFEFLTLEGAQAGLSWTTILRKRENYRDAFYNYDLQRVASMTESDVARLLLPECGIVKHRGKIEATINNAARALEVQREFGSLSSFIWSHVPDGQPIVNAFRTMAEIPTATDESRALSNSLKQRGFKFVGETTMYALMQAVGLVDDHLVSCPCRAGAHSGGGGRESGGAGGKEA